MNANPKIGAKYVLIPGSEHIIYVSVKLVTVSDRAKFFFFCFTVPFLNNIIPVSFRLFLCLFRYYLYVNSPTFSS